MHPYGDFRLQFIRQCRQHPLLVQGAAFGPRVREPPYDPSLQLATDLSERHVLLHTVHAVLEVHARHVHVGDHRADVADDRGEDQHPGQEVRHDEEVLGVVLRHRRLPDRRQRQGRPVEAVYVLAHQRPVDGSVEVVDPVVGPETYRVTDGEVEARVPVDQHEDGEHHLADPEDVGVVGVGLGLLEPLPQAGQSKQTVEPDDHRAGDRDVAVVRGPPEVDDVGGEEG